MRRGVISSLAILLVGVSWGHADLLIERNREQDQVIPARSVLSYIDTFKANQRAVAIASGKGRTCLCMYVFDEHGNCVARDDRSSPNTSDDMAVEWIPIATTRYDVQIYNGGIERNAFQLALR